MVDKNVHSVPYNLNSCVIDTCVIIGHTYIRSLKWKQK